MSVSCDRHVKAPRGLIGHSGPRTGLSGSEHAGEGLTEELPELVRDVDGFDPGFLGLLSGSLRTLARELRSWSEASRASSWDRRI